MACCWRAVIRAKARELLEYEPKFTLQEGFARTAEWYKQHGLI